MNSLKEYFEATSREGIGYKAVNSKQERKQVQVGIIVLRTFFTLFTLSTKRILKLGQTFELGEIRLPLRSLINNYMRRMCAVFSTMNQSK